MRKIFAIIFLALTSLRAGIAANPVEFDRANQQYDQGSFEEARKLFEALVNARNFSSNLFYNLGNAAYRLEDKGAAMLAHERALALEPAHPEALSNLEFLRNQTGAKIARPSWIEHLFLPFDVSSYAWIAAAAAWVALFCIAAVAFGRSSAKSRLWTGAICSAVVFTYAAAAVSRGEATGARGRHLAAIRGAIRSSGQRGVAGNIAGGKPCARPCGSRALDLLHASR